MATCPTPATCPLPDLTGAEEPSHLLGLLAHATGYETRDVADYAALGDAGVRPQQ
jgi:hypothetical protein